MATGQSEGGYDDDEEDDVSEEGTGDECPFCGQSLRAEEAPCGDQVLRVDLTFGELVSGSLWATADEFSGKLDAAVCRWLAGHKPREDAGVVPPRLAALVKGSRTDFHPDESLPDLGLAPEFMSAYLQYLDDAMWDAASTDIDTVETEDEGGPGSSSAGKLYLAADAAKAAAAVRALLETDFEHLQGITAKTPRKAPKRATTARPTGQRKSLS